MDLYQLHYQIDGIIIGDNHNRYILIIIFIIIKTIDKIEYQHRLTRSAQNMIKNNWKLTQKYPLSSCWSTSQRMTSCRLSFFGKGITSIDKLQSIHSSTLQSIKQLDLSHNAIVKVENMKQFPNLQVINLAHNHITDGRQILKLSKLNKIKTILVKGNPFLKSGQGKMQALKYLICYNTDVEILTSKQQSMLNECIKNYCRKQVKKQYISHVQLQIELISQFNISVAENSTGSVYHRIVNSLIDERIEECEKYCRNVVARNVTKLADMQVSGMESKEYLQQWFERCLYQYSQKIQNQLDQQETKLFDKLQIFQHVKNMRKQRYAKQNYTTNFRKPPNVNKPLLVKPNNQNIPKLTYSHSSSNLPRREPVHSHNVEQPSMNENSKNMFDKSCQQQLRKLLSNENVNLHGHGNGSKRNLQQKFQAYYGNMLTKYSPVYQLLYSPLHSLKSKQKDLLIQTLSIHLKQKSFIAFKAQKLKQEYTQLAKKYIQKQRCLKQAQQKLVQNKMITSEKVKQLQQNMQQKQHYHNQCLQLLTQREQNLRQISQIHEQLGEQKLANIKKTSIIERIINHQQLYERMQRNRENRIKKQATKLLIYKADKYNKLRVLHKINKQKLQRDILEDHFYGLKLQVYYKSKQRQLQDYLTRSCLYKSMGHFVGTTSFQVKQKKLIKSIKRINGLTFFNIVKQIHHRSKQIHQKIQKHIKRQQYIKQKYLMNVWKQSIQDQKQRYQIQRIQQHYNHNLMKKYYKNWLIFTKMPIYQQAQLSVNMKLTKMHKFYYCLSNQYMHNYLHKQKFINLIVFLNKNKRLHNFYKIKQYTTQNLQIIARKQRKVTTRILSNSFKLFTKIARYQKYVNKQMKSKNKKLFSLRVKNTLGKLNSEQNMRKLRMKKLFNIFDRYRKNQIALSFRQSIKEFMIQDKCIKSDIKLFFSLLNSQYKDKLKHKNKIIQLKYIVNTNLALNKLSDNYRNKKQFMHILYQPIQQRKRLTQFIRKRFYTLMNRCYKQWRVQVYKTQIQYLKNRIKQFGPQIEQISKRQKTTFEQKIVLMNIIDSKQKTIRGFIKQLEQAQYTIKTKQQKYKKLKQFMHEAGEDITIMGSKVQPMSVSDSMSYVPQRDFNHAEDTNQEYFSTFRRF